MSICHLWVTNLAKLAPSQSFTKHHTTLSHVLQYIFFFVNYILCFCDLHTPVLKVIKLFSCSAQLRLKFILLINVKMPTIVGILTFISRINYRHLSSKPSTSIYLGYFGIYEQFKF